MAGTGDIDTILDEDAAANSNIPSIPVIDVADADKASVEYSQHRTKLSTHRTALSEHRTSLSERRSEMSSRRTGMSFQRTRLSAERTLMSVMRTSISLIGFGFTIFQFFRQLQEKNLFNGPTGAARNFGLALIYLGIAMTAVGIAYHVQFMLGLRQERVEMTKDGLLHSQSRFPVSFTLVTAFLLLFIGIAAVASLSFHVGPFI